MGFKRRRRTSEQARLAIMNVAEQHLIRRGPTGLRLQEVARELGISHPAILHHFGNREGLVEAVVERTMRRIEADVVATLTSGEVGPDLTYQTLHQIVHALADQGAARFMAWLLLSREGEEGEAGEAGQIGYDTKLRGIAEVIHARRTSEAAPGSKLDFDDTLFTVVLAGVSMFGAAIVGDAFRASAGLAGDDSERFLRWFSELLHNHLVPDR